MAEQSWSNCYRATVSVEYDYLFISFKVLTLLLSVFFNVLFTVGCYCSYDNPVLWRSPHVCPPLHLSLCEVRGGIVAFPSLGKMPSVFCVCVCTCAVFDVDLIASRCVRGWLSGCEGSVSLVVTKGVILWKSLDFPSWRRFPGNNTLSYQIFKENTTMCHECLSHKTNK